MHLKIRTKVLIGILFLFIEFLAIGIMSIYYFSSIKNSTELIIKKQLSFCAVCRKYDTSHR